MTRKISALIEKQRAEKERKREGILRLRLEYRMTYNEIGQALGISRERVRQLIGPEKVKRPSHQPQNRKPTEGEKFYKRFWANIDIRGKDECWEWKAGRGSQLGYGRLRIAGGYDYAHRVMYRIKTGEEIPAGMVVMHTCDRPDCVNPNHLVLGTQSDNVHDRDRKGRHKIVAMGKRREKEILRTVNQSLGGMTIRQLAKSINVTKVTAYQCVRRLEKRGLVRYDRDTRGSGTPGLVYARSTAHDPTAQSR